MFLLEVVEDLYAFHVKLEPAVCHLSHLNVKGDLCPLNITHKQFEIPRIISFILSVEIQLPKRYVKLRQTRIKNLTISHPITALFDLRVVSLDQIIHPS